MRSRPISFALVAPVLALCLLGGVAWERSGYTEPQDVEPYHARARAAIDAIPYSINGGQWNGKDTEEGVPPAAQKLLKPNAYLSRRYVEKGRDAAHDREVHLLIVQCGDARDMQGHYPPICYPASGRTEVAREARDWVVGGLTIGGIAYKFAQQVGDQTHLTTVYDFFVVPDATGNAIKRDMDAVRAAAEDYQQRYYGAAQVQLVFSALASAELSRAEQDEIFTTLLEPLVPTIKTLASGGLP